MLFRDPFPLRVNGYAFAAFLAASLLLVALIDPLGFAMHVAALVALLVVATLAGLLLGAAVYVPALLVCWLYRRGSLRAASTSAFRASRCVCLGVLEFAGSITP